VVLCFDKQGGGAGLYFLQGHGGIPPTPPSAMPLLGRTEFLATALFFSLPRHPCAEKFKELPKTTKSIR